MPRIMRRLIAAAFLSTFLVAPSALAQETDVPTAPTVDDPMLVPVPRAKVEIGTWEQALQHVRARSTDLRIAAYTIERAEAQQRVALAGALPSLNGTAAFTHQLITKDSVQIVGGSIATGVETRTFTTPPSDYFTGQLVAVQPVIALRAWHAMGTARVATDASRLSFDDAKRQIALSVANSIVGVVTAERIAELNRVGLSNALSRVELTTRKASLGGANGLDVVRTRQDVEVARATLVAGDESLRQSREALGIALGLAEQVGVPPNVDISGLERDARATCKPAATVDERPDVAALRTQVEVAVLSVPLWEGGARYGNLRDAHAQEAIADQRLEQGRRTAIIQVDQARRGVTVAESSRRVAVAARDLAAETDRLVRLSYQEGRGTSLELITAAQSLRESEIQLALRDFELVKARVLAVLALASCPW